MTEEVTQAETQVDLSEENVTPQISINDLADCVKIIDLCAKRGAFEGSEFEAVGKVRNRLVTFVNSTVPAEEEDPSKEEGTPESTSEGE